jgi:hypothetical protein
MEITHWEREVNQFVNRHDNPQPFETRFAVEARKMLSYYSKKLSQERDKAKPENENLTNFTAKEYALTYIFDLYANGRTLPTNRVEGGYNAKQIENDSKNFPTFDKKPDSFYRAVKEVIGYDLNNARELSNISKDWYYAVKTLSNSWGKTQEYLQENKLTGE